MRKINKFICVAIMLISPFFMFSQSGKTMIKTTLDSATLLMGKQTSLHIEIVQDENITGRYLNTEVDTLSRYIDIINRLKPDTTDIGNGRIQIDHTLIIQSFDSGTWSVPGIKYTVGKDTFTSNSLNLKVLPVPVDTLTTIHDFKSVVEPPFNIFDYLPDFITDYWWIYLIVLVLVAIALYVYFKWIRKGKRPSFAPKKQIIPPYEEAIIGLNGLKERKLWQAGQEKEYYTILTDILRTYIDRRFKINAMEMTSSQIIAILKKNDEAKAVNEQLKLILEVADFVKFAKVRPLPDDNETAFIRAMTFVEETRPVEIKTENVTNKENQNNIKPSNKE